MAILWNERMSVNIALFDRQHRRLVNLINFLQDEMRAGKGREALKPVINELYAYAVEHFNAEESYFQRYGYPDAAKHVEEHRAFVSKVKEFSRELDAGSVELSKKVLHFLGHWLRCHIMGSDKMYSEFFRKHGVS